jgi:hypothetical protein
MSTEPAEIPYEASATFAGLLEILGYTLAITVCTAHRVILLSAECGTLDIHSRSFNRPMGLATAVADGLLRLAVARAERRMGGAARQIHDSGNHRTARR